MTTPPDESPEFLTVEEAAALLRMSERTVSRMLKAGKLPGIFGGTREGWRIRRADLLHWTTNQPPKPQKETPE